MQPCGSAGASPTKVDLARRDNRAVLDRGQDLEHEVCDVNAALHHPRRDSIFVAAAGPAMNFALATLAALAAESAANTHGRRKVDRVVVAAPGAGQSFVHLTGIAAADIDKCEGRRDIAERVVQKLARRQ